MLSSKLLMTVGGEEKLWVEDCFSAYTYTGNGATQTINNGIDLAGKGGMVWLKARSGPFPTTDHYITNTVSGVLKRLKSNTTDGELTVGATVFPSFNSDGFTVNAAANDTNYPANNYASWTFRTAPKFFLNTTVTKSAGSNATIDLSSLGAVGMVIVKRTDAAGSWYVFHRSATAGNLLYLEQNAAEATLGHITVSGTTLTLVNGVIADGSYVVYAWAHDSSADGIIQCGSFTSDIGGLNINLGWELQYLLVKCTSGAVPGWNILDVSRGMAMSGGAILQANNASAEFATSLFTPTATGFYLKPGQVSTGIPFVYIAIRRSNKPPTLGTQVYNAIARTGTGANSLIVGGSGFTPDLLVNGYRSTGGTQPQMFTNRLLGANVCLRSNTTASEVGNSNYYHSSLNTDGYTQGSMEGSAGSANESAKLFIDYFFKRAPGVFSILCDTGTAVNKLENHNLGSIPELMIRKGRSGATQWEVYFSSLGNTKKLVLNSTAAEATDTTAWNSTSPTATQVSIGTGTNVNTTADTYVTYLMSSLAGISKVGTYTGNGSTQTVDMGFTTGCRFFLVKASSTTGSWWVFDSVRGIVASTDFGLQLNSTAAEVTSADAVDPATVGIAVVQEATCSLNANGVIYQYWAMA